MAMGLDTAGVTRLIRSGETLTVELKGEGRAPLPDREIYEVVRSIRASGSTRSMARG